MHERIGSNSTTSVCCGFVAQLVDLLYSMLYNESSANRSKWSWGPSTDTLTLCGQHVRLQSSLIQDVRAAVAENAHNGTGVARGNVTPCGRDVTYQRDAISNSRDELKCDSSYASRSSRDTVAKPSGNPISMHCLCACL